MKLLALMAFYRERPDWLYENLTRLPKAGVSHVLAVDGAYATFPKATRRSSQAEHDALRQGASDAGLSLTIKTPLKPWASEVAKRSYMFRAGERITEPNDWYFIVDSDYFVTEASDVLKILSDADRDAAGATLTEPKPDTSTTTTQIRLLFRAIRGLRVVGNHFTYMTPDGWYLLGPGGSRKAPAFLVEGLTIEHRTFLRDEARHADAYTYYRDRDAQGLEVGKCEYCGNDSTTEVPADWQPLRGHFYGSDGQLRLTSRWKPVCAEHLERARAQNRVELARFGLNPELVRCTYQNSAGL